MNDQDRKSRVIRELSQLTHENFLSCVMKKQILVFFNIIKITTNKKPTNQERSVEFF